MRLDQGKTYREINRFNAAVTVTVLAIVAIAWLLHG